MEENRLRVWFVNGKIVCYSQPKDDVSDYLHQLHPNSTVTSLLVPAAPWAIDWSSHKYFNILEEADAGAGY